MCLCVMYSCVEVYAPANTIYRWDQLLLLSRTRLLICIYQFTLLYIKHVCFSMATEDFCLNDIACLGNIAGTDTSHKYAIHTIIFVSMVIFNSFI